MYVSPESDCCARLLLFLGTRPSTTVHSGTVVNVGLPTPRVRITARHAKLRVLDSAVTMARDLGCR